MSEKARVAFFFGTRPEIIKLAPVVREALRRSRLQVTLIHTGQHYDNNLSDSIIHDAGLPAPDLFLGVGSNTQGAQTANILSRSEKALEKIGPDVTVVLGDTNSVLGVSLAAAKLRVPVAHIEAGCRSHDATMTEEINRTVTSDLARVHFAPTSNCVANLLKEGIRRKDIHMVGHPLVDELLFLQRKIDPMPASPVGLKHKEYYFATLHREENVDDRDRLNALLVGLRRVSTEAPLVVALHPRTSRRVEAWGLGPLLRGMHVSGPVSYPESLRLIRNARIVLTDSGGIQQETALLGTPCITLRSSTEWVETIRLGVNSLASPASILRISREIEGAYSQLRRNFKAAERIFGAPGVSRSIVDIIEERVPALSP